MDFKSTSRPFPAPPPASADFGLPYQRPRIIAAFAAEVSERGYGAVTVTDVAERAGIARKTFYENFSSKEECLLATQEFGMATALERIVDAAGLVESWPQRVAAGTAAFLAGVAEERALARACIVEALAAGPAPARYHQESLQSFVSLFGLGRDVSQEEKLPETIAEALVGGIFWIVYGVLAESPAGEVEELLPELVEFALTPYLGREAARTLPLPQRS